MLRKYCGDRTFRNVVCNIDYQAIHLLNHQRFTKRAHLVRGDMGTLFIVFKFPADEVTAMLFLFLNLHWNKIPFKNLITFSGHSM